MKSLKEFYLSSIEEIDTGLEKFLESEMVNTTTSGVDNPDSKPIFKKTKEFGHVCLEVDSNTYSNCIQGKIPYSKWKRYVADNQDLEDSMKKLYRKNKRLLIKNKDTGSMTFIK